jgi:hypothetical protein
MRKLLQAVLCLLLTSGAIAQNNGDYVKGATLGFSVGGFDFATPQLIRSSSLATVLKDKQWAKFSDQDWAVGIHYTKGLGNYFDASANIVFGSVEYPYGNNKPASTSSAMLTELDASVNMKLLTDKHIFVPYLTAGVGMSIYKSYFDAFMPLGAGFQIKMGSDNYIFSNFQYRVPVTQRANYHFYSNVGIGISIDK